MGKKIKNSVLDKLNFIASWGIKANRDISVAQKFLELRGGSLTRDEGDMESG